MKLKELAVDEKGFANAVRLTDLHPGLNVIHVDRDTDARLIRHAVRQWLFLDCNLSRNSSACDQTKLAPLLDRDLFDAFFTAEAHADGVAVQSTGRILRERLLAIQEWNEWPNEIAYLQWRQQADARLERHRCLLEARRQSEQTAAVLRSDLENAERLLTDRRASMIENARRSDAERARLQQDLLEIDRQLAHLVQQIEEATLRWEQARREVRYEPIQHPRGDRLGILYEYLDDIEIELRRWRQTLAHVQQQRVRLRDEMVLWNQLPLDATEHPYHTACNLISNLADLNDQLAQLGDRIPQDSRSEAQLPIQSELVSCSESLQRGLTELCDELGNQYRQVRHRAAVVELRQLRHHYQSIRDNIQSLERRREQLVELIGKIDLPGAQSIEDADAAFLEYAWQHGFLSARRHFVGPEPVAGEVQYRLVRPDAAELESRIAALQDQRDQWSARQRELSAALQTATEHARLPQQSALRAAELEIEQLRSRLGGERQRLHELNKEVETLERCLAEDRLRGHWQCDDTLKQANAFLSRATRGEFQSLRLAPVGFAWELIDRNLNSVSWERLEDALRNRVVLCVRLAAALTLTRRGIQAPFVAECVFDTWPPAELESASAIVQEAAAAGLQVLLMTRQSQVWEHFQASENDGSLRLFNWSARYSPFVPLPLVRSAAWENSTANSSHLAAQSWRAPLRPVVYVDESNATFSHVAVDAESIGQPSSSGPYIQDTSRPGELPVVMTYDRNTLLGGVELIDSLHVRQLQAAGIDRVGHLLDLDPARLPDTLLRGGILPAQIDRWQAQARLMLSVSGLTPRDARLLVACGVRTVQQLAQDSATHMAGRIRRYLESPDGRRLLVDEQRYSPSQLAQWQRAALAAIPVSTLRLTPSQPPSRTIGGVPQYTAAAASRNEVWNATSDRNRPSATGSYFSRQRRMDLQPGRSLLSHNKPLLHPTDFARHKPAELPAAPSSIPRPLSGPIAAPAPSVLPDQVAPASWAASAASNGTAPTQNGSAHKHYLNLDDPVEAAPSIGPKTAERFTAIGVKSIADFLRLSADSMAERIAYKRITGSVIRQWQQQCSLVLRVPNLRGHDAQLLVACGITEPEQLAVQQPRQLFETIGPFAETKEGIKIIRAGKKPTLEEVGDWIRWAQASRSLQAA